MSELHGERPVRVADFRLEPHDEDNLLVDAAGHRMLALNETATALWDLCDGATTIDEMVTAVVELFGVDPVDVQADVSRSITQLHDAGAISYYRP